MAEGESHRIETRSVSRRETSLGKRKKMCRGVRIHSSLMLSFHPPPSNPLHSPNTNAHPILNVSLDTNLHWSHQLTSTSSTLLLEFHPFYLFRHSPALADPVGRSSSATYIRFPLFLHQKGIQDFLVTWPSFLHPSIASQA